MTARVAETMGIRARAFPGKRVVFRCDAGGDDGLGHVMRCLTLARAFCDEGAPAPVFVTHAPDGLGSGIIKAAGFQRIPAGGAGGTAEDLGALLDVLGTPMADTILVLDHKAIDAAYVTQCGKKAVCICIDDEIARDLPCDILVNYHPWISDADYGKKPGRTLLAGLRYNLVAEPYFRCAAGRADEGDTPRVLVTLGGRDPFNHTLWVIENLSEALNPVPVTIVVGAAHPSPDSIRKAAAEKLPGAKLVFKCEDMAGLMATSDIAITACGTTTYDLAVAGVAQLGFIIDNSQKSLGRALGDEGVMDILADGTALDAGGALDVLNHAVTNAERRAQMTAKGQSLLPEPGAALIVRALANAPQELRRNNHQ